jgi:glycosyltransferase involved in cell wall biosynthesis
MKILLVSWSILPRSGGSSVIVENLAKHFEREELVVLGGRELFLSKDVDRNPQRAQFLYFWSEITILGTGARFFEWFARWRFNALLSKIEKLITENKIDHVIGVYPNSLYCLAAARAAKNKNIHFSSYFHNTYVENTAITHPKADAWQKEIFDNSEKIFVMSKGMQCFYEEKYGIGKFEPLVHTFEDFPSEESGSEKFGGDKKVYNLVAIGNFNESNLDATKRFLEAIKNNPKYKLSVYTHVPKVLLQKRGIDTSIFKYMGAVKPDEIHEALQKHDICVLTHGFTGGYGEIEYKTIFPTRTIPMLLSGKPIFAHSPKDSFLNDFLKEHKCAELVETMDRIVQDEAYRAMLIRNAKKAAMLFYGPEVSNKLKRTLYEASL